MAMYGEHHLREIDGEIRRVVEEKLSPFSAALRQLNGAEVDRDTARLNNLAESEAPAALALHFRYIGCNPILAESRGLPRLMAIRQTVTKVRFLGQAMAEIVEAVPAAKVPAAMLQARMRLVAMTASGTLELE